MTEPTPIRGPGKLTSQATSTNQTNPTGGPRFEALLEKLQVRADDLHRASSQLDRPGMLASALDTSRASIEEASSLHRELIETLRAQLQQQPIQTEEAD